MLAAAFSLLFAYASAQTPYFLGDPITTTAVNTSQFHPGLDIEVKLIGFYLQFEGSGANQIRFEAKNITIRHNSDARVALKMNFGTKDSPLVLPAAAPPVATIYATGEVFTRVPRKFIETKSVAIQTVSISRHLTYLLDGGFLNQQSKLPTSFQVLHKQITNATNTRNWAVQLVYLKNKADKQFTVYDTMTVTSATPSPGVSFITLSGTWNKAATTPMSCFLMVGFNDGTGPFNNYAINGNSLNGKYSFVVLDNKFKLTAPASVHEYNTTSITLTTGLASAYWWVIAEDTKTKQLFALNCNSQKDSAFGTFEWYTRPIGFKTYPQLPVGDYALWVAYSDIVTANADNAVTYPKMKTTVTMQVMNHEGMWKYPITFTKNGAQTLGKSLIQNTNITVDVFSTFSTVYLQWFRKSTNSSYTNSSNGNRTKGFVPDGVPVMHSTKPGQTTTLWAIVPASALNLSFSSEVRLYGWTKDCDGNHFGQNFVSGNITVPPAPSPGNAGSSKLGPGAIVGIVCAVVFVCGVAAWWLCMRKSGGQDRYQKLDQN